MIKDSRLKVKVTFAWWFKPYINMLIFFAEVTGQHLDDEKLVKVIQKAIRVKPI